MTSGKVKMGGESYEIIGAMENFVAKCQKCGGEMRELRFGTRLFQVRDIKDSALKNRVMEEANRLLAQQDRPKLSQSTQPSGDV